MAAMPHTPSGHIEQLPSGSWRARVRAGKDPLTGREIRFRKTCKTEPEAQIELGSGTTCRRAPRRCASAARHSLRAGVSRSGNPARQRPALAA